jgi:hypothetical protein
MKKPHAKSQRRQAIFPEIGIINRASNPGIALSVGEIVL